MSIQREIWASLTDGDLDNLRMSHIPHGRDWDQVLVGREVGGSEERAHFGVAARAGSKLVVASRAGQHSGAR